MEASEVYSSFSTEASVLFRFDFKTLQTLFSKDIGVRTGCFCLSLPRLRVKLGFGVCFGLPVFN